MDTELGSVHAGGTFSGGLTVYLDTSSRYNRL